MRCRLLLVCLLLAGTVQAAEAPFEVAGATTVNALQARQLYEFGVLFIDVRPVREWSWGHVHGALHLELDGRFIELAETDWPRGMPIVLYCDSEVCPQSAEAARRAVRWGFQHVYYFRSGYFAWQLLDFPLGKGREGELFAFTLGEH
ncbi:rhodanese-like domain-containing protein [Pseudomonas sp. L-22-4S-12]|uniref:rhodanese-like domain-containing protein n=1 Tax=Pseudomonas sp. L-22-4S-12 TaxID=2610893 RepID=UPI001322C4EB|nr:rhodanese-like domain-containing protein [Pseudomonas sp. L-22-4S-12]MWV16796.1 rhodanese-like domain-containing protein [Pseudomonas sp. L-22-4S-12]